MMSEKQVCPLSYKNTLPVNGLGIEMNRHTCRINSLCHVVFNVLVFFEFTKLLAIEQIFLGLRVFLWIRRRGAPMGGESGEPVNSVIWRVGEWRA